jgi:hypothetical protein
MKIERVSGIQTAHILNVAPIFERSTQSLYFWGLRQQRVDKINVFKKRVIMRIHDKHDAVSGRRFFQSAQRPQRGKHVTEQPETDGQNR